MGPFTRIRKKAAWDQYIKLLNFPPHLSLQDHVSSLDPLKIQARNSKLPFFYAVAVQQPYQGGMAWTTDASGIWEHGFKHPLISFEDAFSPLGRRVTFILLLGWWRQTNLGHLRLRGRMACFSTEYFTFTGGSIKADFRPGVADIQLATQGGALVRANKEWCFETHRKSSSIQPSIPCLRQRRKAHSIPGGAFLFSIRTHSGRFKTCLTRSHVDIHRFEPLPTGRRDLNRPPETCFKLTRLPGDF